MANPKASSSSLFSWLADEDSPLIKDLSKLELSWASSVPVLGLVLCWSCSSLGVCVCGMGGVRAGSPCRPSLAFLLRGAYFLTRYPLC